MDRAPCVSSLAVEHGLVLCSTDCDDLLARPRTAQRPPSRDSALKSSAAAALPSNPDCVEVAPGPGEDAGAAVEPDRVVPIHGQREGHTHAYILLQIIAPHAVERRAPAGSGDLQTDPYDGILLVVGELLQGKRGGPVEVDREPE